MGFPLSSICKADRVIRCFLRENEEKGNEGFAMVLGVGDEIMILDPKKFEERNEFEAIRALLLLLRRHWDEVKFELNFERKREREFYK